MPITLKYVPCVNCHLATRADQLMCQHGNHRRDISNDVAEHRSGVHRKPTAEDLEDYFLWLSQTGATHIIN